MGQPFKTAAIIGMGLMGSSLARAFRKHGAVAQVLGYDNSPETCAQAKTLAVFDTVISSPAELAAADLVILCVPVGAMAAVMDTIAPHLQAGAVLTDVGSTKQSVIDRVAPRVPAGVTFIPSHPIAGTENSGPGAGFAELFERRKFVITPLPETHPQDLERLQTVWQAIGSEVITMDARQHDEVLALTSHLPHLLAFGLMTAILGKDSDQQRLIFDLGGGSFRDITRVAASDPVMWRDIFLDNKEALQHALTTLQEGVSIIQAALNTEDSLQLQDFFLKARQKRRDLPHLDYGHHSEAERFNEKN